MSEQTRLDPEVEVAVKRRLGYREQQVVCCAACLYFHAESGRKNHCRLLIDLAPLELPDGNGTQSWCDRFRPRGSGGTPTETPAEIPAEIPADSCAISGVWAVSEAPPIKIPITAERVWAASGTSRMQHLFHRVAGPGLWGVHHRRGKEYGWCWTCEESKLVLYSSLPKCHFCLTEAQEDED